MSPGGGGMVDTFPLSHHGSSTEQSRDIRIMLAAYQSAQVINKVVEKMDQTRHQTVFRSAIWQVGVFLSLIRMDNAVPHMNHTNPRPAGTLDRETREAREVEIRLLTEHITNA